MRYHLLVSSTQPSEPGTKLIPPAATPPLKAGDQKIFLWINCKVLSADTDVGVSQSGRKREWGEKEEKEERKKRAKGRKEEMKKRKKERKKRAIL